jgi:BirA family biotin operon repressor/biotin-[acetyl-CoA-carboxylase] ligase
MFLYSELDTQKIKANVGESLIGSKIILVNEVDSTNELAKSHVEKGSSEGTVFLAESQTKGKGRLGRTWHSPPGSGIYLSVLLNPDIPVIQLSPLTLMTGVAVAKGINSFQPLSVDLKWPNDILLNGKKLGGILCELVPVKEKFWVVLGIGVNVNHEKDHFSPDLHGIATSLNLESEKCFDRALLIISILKSLDQNYHSYLTNGIKTTINDWVKLTKMFGKSVRITHGGQMIEGVALGLDDQGSIILRLENGEEKSFKSGEVTFHKG